MINNECPSSQKFTGILKEAERHNAGRYKSMGTISSSDVSTTKEDLLLKTTSKREPELKILSLEK